MRKSKFLSPILRPRLRHRNRNSPHRNRKSLVTCGLPAHRVSDAENVSIWWRHNDSLSKLTTDKSSVSAFLALSAANPLVYGWFLTQKRHKSFHRADALLLQSCTKPSTLSHWPHWSPRMRNIFSLEVYFKFGGTDTLSQLFDDKW